MLAEIDGQPVSLKDREEIPGKPYSTALLKTQGVSETERWENVVPNPMPDTHQAVVRWVARNGVPALSITTELKPAPAMAPVTPIVPPLPVAQPDGTPAAPPLSAVETLLGYPQDKVLAIAAEKQIETEGLSKEGVVAAILLKSGYTLPDSLAAYAPTPPAEDDRKALEALSDADLATMAAERSIPIDPKWKKPKVISEILKAKK